MFANNFTLFKLVVDPSVPSLFPENCSDEIRNQNNECDISKQTGEATLRSYDPPS